MKNTLVTWSIADNNQLEWWKISVKSLFLNKKNKLNKILIITGTNEIKESVLFFLKNWHFKDASVVTIDSIYHEFGLEMCPLAKGNATIWSLYLPFLVKDNKILSLDNDIIFFKSKLIKKMDMLKFNMSKNVVLGRKQEFNKDFGPYKYFFSKYPLLLEEKGNADKKIINGGLYIIKNRWYKNYIKSVKFLNLSIQDTYNFISSTNEKWPVSEEIEIFKHLEARTSNKLSLRSNATLWLKPEYIIDGIKNEGISIHFIGSTKEKLNFFNEDNFQLKNKEMYKRDFICYYTELNKSSQDKSLVVQAATLIFENFWEYMLK